MREEALLENTLLSEYLPHLGVQGVGYCLPYIKHRICCPGGGFVRVYLTNGSLINSSAISIALFAIVMTSVLTGTALPFGLAKIGVDPANAGTSIQVKHVLLCKTHAAVVRAQKALFKTNALMLRSVLQQLCLHLHT